MINLHTHTYRCKHAVGDVPDYLTCAEAAGITTLGFSDHTPYPDGRWKDLRMDYSELDDYARVLSEASQLSRGITVLKGLECEWIPELASYYENELLGSRGFQYLIGAEHWFPYDGTWRSLTEIKTPAHLQAYTDNLIRAMESGLFSFIAHPDMFSIGYTEWDENTASCVRDICAASIATGIPLEINAYGLRKPKISTAAGLRYQYPWKEFWSCAAGYGVEVVCNSDAHKPEDVASGIQDCIALAKRLGLTVRDLSSALREDAQKVRCSMH